MNDQINQLKCIYSDAEFFTQDTTYPVVRIEEFRVVIKDDEDDEVSIPIELISIDDHPVSQNLNTAFKYHNS